MDIVGKNFILAVKKNLVYKFWLLFYPIALLVYFFFLDIGIFYPYKTS